MLDCAPGEVTETVSQAMHARSGKLRELPCCKVGHQARRALARLEESAATWTGWELRRAVTVQLREDGFRVDGPVIERVVAVALALPELRAVSVPEDEAEVPGRACRSSPVAQTRPPM